jgi:arylsulfatase A-like enzyme
MPREYTPDRRDEWLYTNTVLPQPPTADYAYFARLPLSVQTSEARTRWQWRFDTPEKFQENTKDYYRLISGIDREAGRIREELERRGLAGNTVIIFTSDNGYALGDRGLAGKWFMYEESLRVPLLIFDPRQPAGNRGRSEDAMTLNIDFAPTLLDLAGMVPPPGMQGHSLVPLLAHHRPADWRTRFFYEHHYAPNILPPSEGVRTQRWAYIRWLDAKPPLEELFDIQADPLEHDNLAGDPHQAAVLAELRSNWEKYCKDLR